MCLAIPARNIELLDGDQCRVELGGVRKEISLALVDDAAVGDYVIVHVGYALTKLDPEEAAQTLALFAEAGIDPAGALAGDGLPTPEAARGDAQAGDEGPYGTSRRGRMRRATVEGAALRSGDMKYEAPQ